MALLSGGRAPASGGRALPSTTPGTFPVFGGPRLKDAVFLAARGRLSVFFFFFCFCFCFFWHRRNQRLSESSDCGILSIYLFFYFLDQEQRRPVALSLSLSLSLLSHGAAKATQNAIRSVGTVSPGRRTGGAVSTRPNRCRCVSGKASLREPDAAFDRRADRVPF